MRVLVVSVVRAPLLSVAGVLLGIVLRVRAASPTFVGREDELALLRTAFGQEPCALFLRGEAGVGKTALAVTAASFRADGATVADAWVAEKELKELDVFPTPEEGPDFYVDYDETGPYVAETSPVTVERRSVVVDVPG